MLTVARQPLRIAWVTRSLLDYRIPVMQCLDSLCGGGLHLLYGQAYTPPRVQRKLQAVLGDRAVALSGEKCLGPRTITGTANTTVRFVYQPGIFRHIRLVRPDVLVGDGFFQWTSFALAYRMLHRVPLVMCYERTSHTERSAQWFRRAYRRVAVRLMDAMCCNGQLCVEYSAAIGMDSSRITVPNMAAETEGLQARAAVVTSEQKQRVRVGWEARGRVFLYVGQLIARKGLRQLLDAWGAFEKTGAQATLVLIGQGEEETALRRQARELGLRGVRFAGAVDYDLLAPCYASADAFIIPTLEDNWSLVVPEAMSCGLPVLCSKYNGCWPELVQAGRNGWVFDPHDRADLVSCLQEAAGAGERLGAMGEESREIVRDFTPARAAEAIYRACEIATKRWSK